MESAVLRTPDLILSPVGVGDGGALHTLWNDPSLRVELWDGHGLSAEQSRDLVLQAIAGHAERGLGLWIARDRDGNVVGFGGYPPFVLPGELELIYGVVPAYRLRGYARQMLAALVDHAFAVAGVREIRAATRTENLASQRLLRRLGFVAEPEPSPTGKRLYRRVAPSPHPRDAGWEAA